jgi:thiamine transporter
MEHTTNVIIAVATVVAAIALFVVICMDKKRISTRSLAYGAIALALSTALSYVRLWRMPQGGSVTLASMLPIMLYSYMFGSKKGLLIGLAYAGLQSLQDLYFVHPIQFILDYPLAFASLGLVGMFRAVPPIKVKKDAYGYPIGFIAGMIAVCFIRFVCHTLSGVFFFAEYAGEQNVWAYSLGYNSFVWVECAICILAGGLLTGNRAAMKFLFQKEL